MSSLTEFKSSISDALHKRRPLTESTTKTYVSLLSTLGKKLGADDVDFFTKEKTKIMNHIDALDKPTTRKTILSALYVLTGISEYSESMRSNMKKVSEDYAEKKLTPGRAATRLTFDEVKAIHEEWSAKYRRVASEENTVNMLITGLMSGVYGTDCPPRRLLDWCTMKIRNFSKTDDNCMVSREVFRFAGKYKTAAHDKAKGVVPELTVPINLRAVITKWKKLNDSSDFLLINNKGLPFTSGALNKRVTALFGFGVDQLRSIFVSSVLARDLDAVQKANDVAEKMGHSVSAQNEFYRKQA